MGGTNEAVLSKTKKGYVSGKTAVGDKIGSLRFHVNKGEVHAHDDAKGLVFRIEKQIFQDHIDRFIGNHTQYTGHLEIIMRGKAQKKGDKRKPADLILRKGAHCWEASLAELGTETGDIVLGDPVISFLDKFIQGI